MALRQTYKSTIVPALQKQFGYKNIHAVPSVRQVTLNIGVGPGVKDAKYLETAERTLSRVSGQKPVKTLARKSIAGFKIRQGMVVGMKVTLRGKRMWDFLEKLIKISLPRVRDFRGLSPNAFDQGGNYSIGFTEHTAFPEIRSDEIEVLHGLQVTIGTTATSKAEGTALLKALGVPFREEEANNKSREAGSRSAGK
ncbi:MAG: 50S ribosomal protein L5 [Candidatus Uhrbacteria bacterium GW2011_GWA2_53_10]|uniref:Large ribosomal subunit protein uL5 n=1 Tax=Candidatus Uhrbacteria bacterium GW2011_GWA2_53_10 TaxID=1618980 RepID=A0A0G1ZY21_9BACT|nr:MAG: 50S ribosomal protein L5 [Candidatus Uhrbacteria bacterium GW2011_GWA2_53_10]